MMSAIKKTAHAAEQERPDVAARRQDWFDGQPDLDPRRLVFIDETGASTKMTRLRGRAIRGERCRASVPHGHWKTTTFVGALRVDGMTAPWVLDGPMNGAAFLVYVQEVLVPTLLTAIEDSVQLAEAMEARAYGSGPRTSFSVLAWQSSDTLLLLVAVVVVGGFLAARAAGFADDWHAYPSLSAPAVQPLPIALSLLLFLPVIRWR